MNTAAILLNIFLTIYQKAVTGQYKAAEREKIYNFNLFLMRGNKNGYVISKKDFEFN